MLGHQAIPTGRCMCGAVRFQIQGKPSRVLHCHCKSCRIHTGAALATLAVLKADQVTFSGKPRRIYESTPGVKRSFCGNCGTSLTWETSFGDEGAICAIHISTFEEPDNFPPTAHSFYPERIPWFEVADHLPRYEGFVAEGSLLQYGPSGE